MVWELQPRFPVDVNNRKRILVCPLNWGLGHAGRCIPVIKYLLKHNHEVIIGADDIALKFLQLEFPRLRSIVIPDISISYSRFNSQVFKIFWQIPKISKSIKEEHAFLHNLLQHNKFDMIISDNRYGLWNKNVHSVIMTHQLMLKLPGMLKPFEKAMHKWIKRKVEKFNECWVPDLEGFPNLSGDLSHKYVTGNVRYIGPLSQYSGKELNVESKKTNDILAILSGPEPQRTLLEEIFLKIFKGSFLKVKIIQGRPEITKEKIVDNITIIPFLNGNSIFQEINKSKIVICRAGYTTIMELASLNAKIILIPTPGQTEQLYLSKHLSKQGFFCFMDQKSISMQNILTIQDVFVRVYDSVNIPDTLRVNNLSTLQDIFA